MTVASRVSARFLDQEAARRVTSRFLFAMSQAEAKKILKFRAQDRPSRDEVTEKFRELVKKTIRENPGAAADQEELKALNVAKSTLLGELDRANWRPEDEEGKRAPVREVKEWTRVPDEPDEPPPIPEGEPFAAAMSGLGHVEWKLMTDGQYKSDVLVEPDGPGQGLVVVTAAEEKRRKVYFAISAEYILIGRDASHYVFGKLTRRHNSRRGYESRPIDVHRWTASKTVFPLSKDLLKLAPKVVKELRGKSNRVAKYKVIEGTLTENAFRNFRGTLSLPDAISGSGVLAEGADTSTLKGRKTQVEIEPVVNKEKWKTWKANPALRADEHLAYDWTVYINGKAHALSDEEVARLKKSYFLFALYSYDYQGKKNLTRLKGSSMFKMPAKEALEKLAEALSPGAVKSAVEAAATQAAK